MGWSIWMIETRGSALAGAENLSSGNPYLLGDANLDGVVDVRDFNLWNANEFTGVGAWSQGDFNADGFVDISDFNIWNANRFQSALAVFRPEGTQHTLGHMSWFVLGHTLVDAAPEQTDEFYPSGPQLVVNYHDDFVRSGRAVPKGDISDVLAAACRQAGGGGVVCGFLSQIRTWRECLVACILLSVG